ESILVDPLVLEESPADPGESGSGKFDSGRPRFTVDEIRRTGGRRDIDISKGRSRCASVLVRLLNEVVLCVRAAERSSYLPYILTLITRTKDIGPDA
ncbi:MAG: hypothetical protein QGG53_30370, partial [Planctomycetota bacterium]|nr:hypothetical protein [Planctomycetota bacterium]